MDFNQNILYYIAMAISLLLTVFYLFNTIYLAGTGFKNDMTASKLHLIAGIIMIVSIIVAHRYGFSIQFFKRGLIILASGCTITVIWLLISIFTWGGPLK
jgi:hypothetical protein